MSQIKPEVIAILEREGLADALNEIGAVMLGSDGLGKHGHEKWRTKSLGTLREKLFRHLAAPLFDKDSGRHSAAHAGARLLMILQTRIEAQRRPLGDIARP